MRRDLVSLFIENGQYCGLAWVGPSASYGFSVINRGCASGNLSFAHELGHNFGALHDPYVDPGTSPYAYGHGYAVPAAGWRTVMAYNNACSAAGTSCTRIPYFSNPNLTYGSPAQPLGTAATSDNARVHNQNAATVANFRTSGTGGCTFAFSPSSANVAATATSGSTSVTAGTGCAWTTTSNASWLAVGSNSATSGTGTLNYTAAANSGPARSGAITVGGVNFTVSQANGCTYTLSASSASFAASGGSGSVNLTTGAGCAWTREQQRDVADRLVREERQRVGDGQLRRRRQHQHLDADRQPVPRRQDVRRDRSGGRRDRACCIGADRQAERDVGQLRQPEGRHDQRGQDGDTNQYRRWHADDRIANCGWLQPGRLRPQRDVRSEHRTDGGSELHGRAHVQAERGEQPVGDTDRGHGQRYGEAEPERARRAK